MVHSAILVPSLWRVAVVILSSQIDMPSLTDVFLVKEHAFKHKKAVHSKSSSSSAPSLLDITSALSDYLSFLSFTRS